MRERARATNRAPAPGPSCSDDSTVNLAVTLHCVAAFSSPHFGLARVLVRFDHIASRIVNANHASCERLRKLFGCPLTLSAHQNDSGGLWRVGKSLEAFALKVASQWQTAFFSMLPKSA